MSSSDQSDTAETMASTSHDGVEVVQDPGRNETSSDTGARPKRTITLSLKGQESKVYELTLSIMRDINAQLKSLDKTLKLDDEDDESLADSDSLSAMLQILNTDHDHISDMMSELTLLTENKVEDRIQTLHQLYEAELQATRSSIETKITDLQQRGLSEERQAEEALIAAKEELEKQAEIFEQLLEQRRIKRSASEHKKSQGSPQSKPTARTDRTPAEPSTTSTLRSSADTDNASLDMVKQIADNLATSMCRVAPKKSVEPAVFSGDVLEFIDWEVDLDAYLKAEGLEGPDRLRHLKKFVEGEAKKCLAGYFSVSTDESYLAARSKLTERYGNKQAIGRSFRLRLAQWPKISGKDGKAVQEFGDFLDHVRSAMSAMPALSTLDDCEQNEKMSQKLPDWLQYKWARVVAKEELQEKYPSFSKFTEFVKGEARVMMLQISQAHASTRTDKAKDEKRPRQTRSFQATTEEQKNCLFCEKNHNTRDCFILQSKPHAETIAFIQEKRLCFRCLMQNHRSRDCKAKVICKRCNKPSHPTALHDDNWKPRSAGETNSQSKDDKTNPGTAHDVHTKATSMERKVLSMAVPVFVSNGNGKELLVYALLDTQSDSCFISKEVAQYIGARGEATQVTVCTMNGKQGRTTKRYRSISLRGYLTTATTTIHAYEQDELISVNKDQIPTDEAARRMAHLQDIAVNLPPLLDAPVGILIGADCPEALTPLSSLSGGPGQTFAVETMFGWTLCGGPSQGETKQPKTTTFKTETKRDAEILQLLERDFKHTDGNETSQEDLRFMKIMEAESKQMTNGSYELPLPFKAKTQLVDNRAQAERRLEQLTKKLNADPAYCKEYCDFMTNLIREGHAEEVPPSSPTGAVWYIPHFGVRHPKKKKLRVVFDASAKFCGISLNDILLQGPDMVNSLVGILVRFRKDQIAVCCDIEKMFYNFSVPREQRDYLRFLWVSDDLKTTKEYRMTVHLFGAKSSPAVATFGLRKIASDYASISSEAAAFLHNDFYVDDGIISTPTKKEAIQLINDAREICQKGNVRLHKFISNDRAVIDSVPLSERCATAQTLDLMRDQLPSERTLGLEWNVETDNFYFTPNITKRASTKRGVLSMVSQIYDPLGFVAPFILRGKQILQKVTATKRGWDDRLPTELHREWDSWLSELDQVSEMQIPRIMRPSGATCELHHFCDASLKGYGVCSYLRSIDSNGKVNCSLVFAKARVSPLKPVTIPRLELQAAVTAVRVHKLLKKELKMEIVRACFWSDSRIVLGYIANPSKRFHMYVANRVEEIHEGSNSEQWHHVATKENPADLASRGATVGELVSSNWLSGPRFLHNKDITDQMMQCPQAGTIDQSDPEVRPQVTTAVTASVPTLESISSRFTRYGTWKRLTHGIAILRNCMRSKSWKYRPLLPADLQGAEDFILSTAQANHYKLGVNEPSLRKLWPQQDDNGLLRVGGRANKSSQLAYQEIHSVIVPKNAPIAQLLCQHFHEKICHLGRRSTLGAIRSAGYWIVNSTGLVKKLLNRCIGCRRLRRQMETQQMGELPSERLEQTPPFTHVGVDVFGPYYVKDRRTELKRWGLLVTCLYSRAIHIELLEDMSTDSFIQALRCLMALRGPIASITCDNGTNFVGAKNEIRKYTDLSSDEMKRYLLQNRIDWKFNSPSASHQGGVTERLIRSVRAVLNGMALKFSNRMDTKTLRTAFHEAASIVNTRPLTATSVTDPDEMITPSQLLTMKKTPLRAPAPGAFPEDEIYSHKRWKVSQAMAECFWKAWRAEYLTSLMPRHKWTERRENVQVGDVVLVNDENVARSSWSTGTVAATKPGQDGLVRNVTIRMADRDLDRTGKRKSPPTFLDRPVQKLCLLLRP